MGLLPRSPRTRRRLRWIAVPVALVVFAVVIFVLIPEKGSPPRIAGSPDAPQPVARPVTQAHLTAADRKAIDHALDVFLPAAMERKDLALAWTLAGPELRSAQTRKEWTAGSTPVPDYRPKETTFHTWQVVAVEPRNMIFNIVLHPGKGETQPSTEFSGQVVRRGKGWVVNRLYAIATFGITKTTSEVGPADFGALGGRSNNASSKNAGAIGDAGLLPVLAIVGLVLVLPLSFAFVALRRRRQFRQASTASRELPTLPSRYTETKN